MYDKTLVREILSQILQSTQIILKRFEPIQSPEDFTNSDSGLEKLDAICMQLIAIGESLKNLDKVTGGSLLTEYSQIDWKKVMGMRDVISHHYFDLNAEAIFEVCKKRINELADAIDNIIKDIEQL